MNFMIKTFEKQKREIDEDYLKYIRTLPCVVGDSGCCGDVVAHHTVAVGSGGSDYLSIPVCVRHHIPGVHTEGKDTFQKHHGLCFDRIIIDLLIKYIKTIDKSL